MTSFAIERLEPKHDRNGFSCGIEALDRYLRAQASQDMRRRVSNCFVAVPEHTDGSIAGYYTLAASGIALSELPAEVTRRLPHYPMIPAVLLGRLAVDQKYSGRSLGSALLYDAILRTMQSEPAAFTLVVDAKNENAMGFYRRFGFQPFASRPFSLFLPVATAARLIEG